MIRRTLVTATMSVVLSAVMLPSTRADEGDPFDTELQTPPVAVPAPIAGEYEARPASNIGPVFSRNAVMSQPAAAQPQSPLAINPEAHMVPQGMPAQQPGYVRLGAPLYPSPRPNIPIWTGSTMITNQAFAPHEMLYPHTYRSIHGPFYHRVKGGWIWTPVGIKSHERWELQGTQVEVKYRSQPPLWVKGTWFPPATTHSNGYRY